MNAITKQPTPEQVREYLDARGVCCPICKSANIWGKTFDVSDAVVWQPVKCEDCGFEWQDTYRLAGIANHEGSDFAAAPKQEEQVSRLTAKQAAAFENAARRKLAIIRDEAMELSAWFEFILFADARANEAYITIQRIISDAEGIMRNQRGELSL